MFDILKKYNFWNKNKINSGFIRHEYLDRMLSFLDNRLIKVILGQRRVGKSYLLRMLIEYLIYQKNVPSKNILYLNLDIYELDFINNQKSFNKIFEIYKKKLSPKGKIYLFIDEVQNLNDWERICNSLSQDYTDEYEVFITGSNSNLLSSELSTYLSGRYVKFNVYPFSYQEFLGFNGYSNNKKNFINYLKTGGMPELYHLNSHELKVNYINSLRDSIILRDVAQRYDIRNIEILEKLFSFLIDSVGSLFSVNSISKHLSSNGYKTNPETLSTYLDYLKRSFSIHEVSRYDLRGKLIFTTEKKYYLNDTSFKYFLSSSFDLGIGKYLENIVFLHLKRLGYQVYVGKFRSKEIDFVAEKDKEKLYIQVCYLLSNEDTINREFGNLEIIKDNYRKYVLSMDDVSFANKLGIKHMQIWDFINNQI